MLPYVISANRLELGSRRLDADVSLGVQCCICTVSLRITKWCSMRILLKCRPSTATALVQSDLLFRTCLDTSVLLAYIALAHTVPSAAFVLAGIAS
jgi:hypothetical protein